MNTGLKVACVWHDSDVIEVRVIAENAKLWGTANVYVGTDGLLEAASTLAGFPKHSHDKREVTLARWGRSGKRSSPFRVLQLSYNALV